MSISGDGRLDSVLDTTHAHNASLDTCRANLAYGGGDLYDPLSLAC